MKTAFIIHGYNGDTLYTFGPWLKSELEKKGYTVFLPSFPIRLEATYSSWSDIMDKYIKYINSDSIVIAHSIGNPFILQYLVTNNLKIKLYISVAGFCDIFKVPNREDLNKAFVNFALTDAQINKCKELISNRYSLYSDNDYVVPFNILKNFIHRINSVPVFISGTGHMGNRENTVELPQIIDIVNNVL